jgi:hypothetical protein
VTDRPRADDPALRAGLLDADGRLTATAKRRAAQVRDSHRHLLAAVVRTIHGPWVYWCGDPRGQSWWQYAWLDDIGDPAAVDVWCSSCDTVGVVDLSEPSTPRVVAID